MIPPVTNRTVNIGGSQSAASFEISLEDSAHIMGMLREGLYTDRVLAILREYSSNAWDAHRSVGKHELPIRITLPTYGDPSLTIRDFGPGLSHEDVFGIYTKYGRSTKRTSDDVVGMLGIGSKSGFSYSDSFTITSWHDGMRRIYSATLGEDDKGGINLLDTVACDPTETGIEIQIATKPEDRHEFETTARQLFQHMVPRPDINITLPEPPSEQTVLTNGAIVPSYGKWIAVMGCVPYRINMDHLDRTKTNPCLPNLSGRLQFEIGEVAVSTNREELKYTTATKNALVDKFNALVDEYVLHALAQLESGAIAGWDARLRVQVLAKLDLPLPEKWKVLAEGWAKVTYQSDAFTIIHNKSACTRLFVDERTTLWLDDTGNDLSGYHGLTQNDYVVRGHGDKTQADLRTNLDTVLAACGLTGVTIRTLSQLYWTAPPPPPAKRVSNPKHRAKMFVLDFASKKPPYSDNWSPITRLPTSDDVYVVIESFKAQGYKDFYLHFKSDQDLATMLDVELPSVYGYKTSAAKPVDTEKLDGTEYRVWREAWFKSLLTPANIALVELYWHASPKVQQRFYSDDINVPTKHQLKRLIQSLKNKHPIVQVCLRAMIARKQLKVRKIPWASAPTLEAFAERADLTQKKSASYAALKDLGERYPLLRRAGLSNVWSTDERDEWVEYVQLRDAKYTLPVVDNVRHLKSVP